MGIVLDNKDQEESSPGSRCPFGRHDFNPIIEGTQTVGIVCMHCGKAVRENMEHSRVTVDHDVIYFPASWHEEVKHQSTRDFREQYHRKDPRF